jgi:hypothetical protein
MAKRKQRFKKKSHFVHWTVGWLQSNRNFIFKGKILNVTVPFLFKAIIDIFTEPLHEMTIASALVVGPVSLMVGCEKFQKFNIFSRWYCTCRNIFIQ